MIDITKSIESLDIINKNNLCFNCSKELDCIGTKGCEKRNEQIKSYDYICKTLAEAQKIEKALFRLCDETAKRDNPNLDENQLRLCSDQIYQSLMKEI